MKAPRCGDLPPLTDAQMAASCSATLPAKKSDGEIPQLPFMQGADMEDLEDKLFTLGVGQEVLDNWRTKEAACALAHRGQASVLDHGMRRLALKTLVALSDRFVLTVCASALSCGKKTQHDMDMERMDAASLAVAIFHRLDDRVLLGAAAASQSETPELQQLHVQQELQRSCWVLAWLGVKAAAGSALMEVSGQGNGLPEAPPGTAERELEILRALGWSAWCPSLFSWTAFFRTRLLALQGGPSGDQVANVWLASLSMVWTMMTHIGESNQLPPHHLAAGIFYLAFRRVCTVQGHANPLTKEEVASLVWVTGLNADTMEESARVVSMDMMMSMATTRHHTTI